MDHQEIMKKLSNQGISPEKLAMLMEFAGQTQGKSPKDFLPFFFHSAKIAEEKGMDFTDDETSLILETLMPNMSEEERKKIASMRRIAALLARKNRAGK